MPLLRRAGRDIFYELKGDGRPALVLVHGGMCDHRDWDRLLPRVVARHAVLTLDLSAHGRSGGDPAAFGVESCAGDVNGLLDALDLAPAVLVGHSFGTRVVAEAAWARPDNALGLVLIDGSRAYGGHAATMPPAGGAPPQESSLADILRTTVGPFADRTVRTKLLETMAAAPPAVMAACVAAIAEWDGRRADLVLPGLAPSLPVLAIQSTYHDQLTPRRSLGASDASTPYLDFLREAVPNLAVHILPRTGHFSMIERPEEVAARLLAFAGAAFDASATNGRGPA